MGSSFLPGELTAAFLWAQFEEAVWITKERLAIWQRYHERLEALETAGGSGRPVVPAGCQQNAHMYYVLISQEVSRQKVLDGLKRHGIGAVFHYVPLHSSPAGKRYGRAHGDLGMTVQQSERLIRLPLWMGLTEEQQDRVVQVLKDSL
ncbi:dTDP-4-amino-4,6-dideoxygalactose transaminase [Castellaniella defragrans]